MEIERVLVVLEVSARDTQPETITDRNIGEDTHVVSVEGTADAKVVCLLI